MPKKKGSKVKNKNSNRKVLKKNQRNFSIGNLFLICFFTLLLILGYFLYDLPDINNIKPIDTRASITILADDNSVIASYGGKNQKIVRYNEVPQYLIDAIVAIEDNRFFEHFGIDLIGIARAFTVNIRRGSFAQGGSTITQQLTKNLFLTPKKNIKRKVQEVFMALQLERAFTKEEIIEAYINRVYLGAGAYGIQDAAQIYFNKDAKDLSLWESAIIAGLLQAPSRYSPLNNPQLATNRAKTVLAKMIDAGYIRADIDINRIATNIQKHTPYENNRNKKTYFSDWVVNQINSFISNSDEDIIVKTTLNPYMQKIAEDKIKQLHQQINKQNKTEQIALITQDYNGAILAMVGGVDYNKSQFNRATQARRQTGSAFKPLIYLAALENGFNIYDKIDDIPFSEDADYKPTNYNNKYYDRIDIKTALQKSLNVATVNLLQQVGISKLNQVVITSGITANINQDLSAALGTSEVPLIEMNNAYIAFANGGRAVLPYAVKSIENNNGEILYTRRDFYFKQSFKEKSIKHLNIMLESVLENEGTGSNAKFSDNIFMAGKTGTTQNNRDAWFIGYTDKYVTGVWLGNDNNSPMINVTGGNFPALLWRDYNQAIYNLDKSFIPEYKQKSGSFFDMLGKWATSF